MIDNNADTPTAKERFIRFGGNDDDLGAALQNVQNISKQGAENASKDANVKFSGDPSGVEEGVNKVNEMVSNSTEAVNGGELGEYELTATTDGVVSGIETAQEAIAESISSTETTYKLRAVYENETNNGSESQNNKSNNAAGYKKGTGFAEGLPLFSAMGAVETLETMPYTELEWDKIFKPNDLFEVFHIPGGKKPFANPTNGKSLAELMGVDIKLVPDVPGGYNWLADQSGGIKDILLAPLKVFGALMGEPKDLPWDKKPTESKSIAEMLGLDPMEVLHGIIADVEDNALKLPIVPGKKFLEPPSTNKSIAEMTGSPILSFGKMLTSVFRSITSGEYQTSEKESEEDTRSEAERSYLTEARNTVEYYADQFGNMVEKAVTLDEHGNGQELYTTYDKDGNVLFQNSVQIKGELVVEPDEASAEKAAEEAQKIASVTLGANPIPFIPEEGYDGEYITTDENGNDIYTVSFEIQDRGVFDDIMYIDSLSGKPHVISIQTDVDGSQTISETVYTLDGIVESQNVITIDSDGNALSNLTTIEELQEFIDRTIRFSVNANTSDSQSRLNKLRNTLDEIKNKTVTVTTKVEGGSTGGASSR